MDEAGSTRAQLEVVDGGRGGPTLAGPIAFQVHGVATDHGDFAFAGGNISIQKYYHSQDVEPQRNLFSFLQLVRNFRIVHQDILSKATPGTGVWLLRTGKFILWMDPNGNLKILWGTGIPGAGKSVLASIVIHYLEAHAEASRGSICVCYVYFRYSDSTDLTIRGVLEILVKQTIERHLDCASLAEEVFARHLRENTQPTEAELLQLLHMFRRSKAATFYVLDALDEAPDKLQLELVKKLASLDVRLFITSRLLKCVESCLPGVLSISIVAQEEDLEKHIRGGIDKCSNLQSLLTKTGPSLREEMVTAIKRNCHGMFLHASLQLDALCECLSPGEVRRTLATFPFSIEDVYLQTWDRILKQNPTRVALAKVVLVWVLNSSRSMTLEELECAVATSPKTYRFQPGELVPGMSLLSLCCGLVTFEEESRAVRIVHYTAKAMLDGLVRDSFPQPHSHLAKVCITHLTQCGFQNTSLRSKRHFTAARQADPLLAYAYDAWAIHGREALNDDDTRGRLSDFVSQIRAFPSFTSPDLLHDFDILSSLHVIAIHNLPMSLLRHNDLLDPNVTTQFDGESPLRLASWHGHECTVEALLQNPQILVNWPNNPLLSPLMLAARYGYEGIVRRLLAHPKIQVNLKQISSEGASALILAARYGHEGVVRLLLAHPGIRLNLLDNDGWSALMWAARRGHEGVVRLLLACADTQINLVDKAGWSPLMLAANKGHEGIVKLLLARPEIQVNAVDKDGWSALMSATRRAHVGIVKQLLLHPETQVNSVDEEGWTALMLASTNGYEGVVKLLLARAETQTNLADSEGRSQPENVNIPSNSQKGAARPLACSDIQVNVVDKEGWSALMLAAEGGHESIVRLLLDVPHLNIATRTVEDGHNSMYIAWANGHMRIAQLLEECEIRRTGSSSTLEHLRVGIDRDHGLLGIEEH